VTRLIASAVIAMVSVLGCDNRQVWHEPDPTLARMLEQRRGDPYSPSAAFADGKTMREPPYGTIPRDAVDEAPPPITRALVVEGRAHFETTCAVCHGIRGDGISVVATKMRGRPPPSLLEGRPRTHTREQLFVIASQGYGLMPSYADKLSVHERWATVAYVQALQLGQRARVRDLPPDVRAELAKEAP
jgi:mono/diheme cytochrome c family protein